MYQNHGFLLITIAQSCAKTQAKSNYYPKISRYQEYLSTYQVSQRELILSQNRALVTRNDAHLWITCKTRRCGEKDGDKHEGSFLKDTHFYTTRCRLGSLPETDLSHMFVGALRCSENLLTERLFENDIFRSLTARQFSVRVWCVCFYMVCSTSKI